MRVATMFIVAGLVLAVACVCAATDVHWVPGYHLVLPDYCGTQITSGDLDDDGDVDISFPSSGPLRHYWNTGTAGSPAWEADSTVYAAVSWCEGRMGALGDVDADGDLDLVTTCQYPYDQDKLQLCENTGSSSAPQWTQVPGAFDDVPAYVGQLEPSLADIDADGDVDLLIADEFGSLILVENIGSVSSPAWSMTGYINGLPLYGAADLGDVDGDGDLDLVVIGEYSALQCWENVGTPQSFEFVENPSMLSGIDEPGPGWAVELLDIDVDGDLDLLVSPLTGEDCLLYLNERITPVQPASWTSIKAIYR